MSKLKDLLRDVAPVIAGVVGTANPLAGMAVKMLGEKLLGRPDASPAELEKAIAGLAPEQLLELRLSDNAFRTRALEMGYKPHELEAQDRDSARRMQTTALGSGSKIAQEFVYWNAGFWSIASCLYIGCITFIPIPPESLRVVDTVLGFVLGTIVSTLFGYFYGTSFSERGARKAEDRAVRP